MTPEDRRQISTHETTAPARSESDGAATPPLEGRRVGAYRIIREIGHGGMGSVYLAERVDETFHKRVAIKIVRPGIVSPETVGRFRLEREILATLDHPAIARLLDAGSTDEGLPYFVMDYVEGQPLVAWCEQHKADVVRRLELFRAVCSGVQHAHDHMVLHRDLKPANILVTAEGEVKLLDFGIAKLLADPVVRAPADVSTVLPVMTPTYASPEQIRGAPLSVTSDVYTLGVVLYELLTGRWPYGTPGGELHDVVRAICEQEPTVPSTAISQGGDAAGQVRLRRLLEGDLDKILLKALEKDPARRYRSADQFGEDVRRHLEGLPVAAQEQTFTYRAEKFVRRHPVGVMAAILIAIVELVSVFTTVWEIRVRVATPQAVGAVVDIRPELMSMMLIVLALLAATAYFSRAKVLRAAAAVLGGVVFSVFVTVIPIWMRWRRFVGIEHPTQALLLLYAGGVLAGATIALVGWRIARRFGWRGLSLWFVVMSIGGPLRERLYLSLARLEVLAPGIAPWIANTLSWACALLLSYAIMRLTAGAASDDRLARPRIA
jgi:hypothetical protein